MRLSLICDICNVGLPEELQQCVPDTSTLATLRLYSKLFLLNACRERCNVEPAPCGVDMLAARLQSWTWTPHVNLSFQHPGGRLGISAPCARLQARELAAVALAPLCLLDSAEAALGAASAGVRL